MNKIIDELGPGLRSQYIEALSCPMDWRMIDAFANLQEAGALIKFDGSKAPATIYLRDESRGLERCVGTEETEQSADAYGPDSGC